MTPPTALVWPALEPLSCLSPRVPDLFRPPPSPFPNQSGVALVFSVEAATGNLEHRATVPVSVDALVGTAMSRHGRLFLLCAFSHA